MESCWKERECFSQKQEKKELIALMQITENPATWLLYPKRELSEGFENVNFLKNDKKNK